MAKNDGNGKATESRVVVEFAGVGMADIVAWKVVNITPGQMAVLAVWAQMQADGAMVHMMNKVQQQPTPQIVVPTLRRL